MLPGPDIPGEYAGAWAQYYAGPADPLVSSAFSGWWERSTTLLKRAWRPMALVQLIAAVPASAALIVGELMFGPAADTVATTDPDRVTVAQALAPLLTIVPVLAVSLLVALVVPMATTHILVQTVSGRPVSIRAALAAAVRRAPVLLGWNLLAFLLMLVAVVFCVLPVFYVAAVVAVLPVIVLLERGNGIGRAFRLFHANLGTSVGRLATMAAVAVGFGTLSSILSSIIEGGTVNVHASPAAAVIAGVLGGAVSLGSAVVLAPMYLTTYADMRARYEPFSTAYLMSVDRTAVAGG